MKSYKNSWALLVIIPVVFFLALPRGFAFNDGKENPAIKTVNAAMSPGAADRRTGIHDGNLIRSAFSNFGILGSRPYDIRGEWPKSSGVNYLFESVFFVGAEVTDANGNIIHIFTDSYDGGPRDRPEDNSHVYSWQPLTGFFNTQVQFPEYKPDIEQERIFYPAMSHLPETWPPSWPNRISDWDGKWIGEFGPYPIANQESYYVMDDRDNDEFAYYPFVGSHQDSLPWPDGRRGLGVEVEVRNYQFADPRLANTWFSIYDMKNVSDKDLEKVVCGFYHDFDVGTEGPSSDAGDDFSAIDLASGIIYQWDKEGLSSKKHPTYFVGTKIIQSPDDLGLTSFFGTSSGDVITDDEEAWNIKTMPGVFTNATGDFDVAFITGSGYFSLLRDESKRYAIIVTMGEDLQDIYLNAKFAQWFYDGGYKFDVHNAELAFPAGGETVDGVVDVQWSASGAGDPISVDIFYSTDNWKTWHLIAENEANDGSYAWDTNEVTDGINYSVKVIAHNNFGMGESLASGYFTVNNPVPAHPEVLLTSPVTGEAVSGLYTIRWRAGDADGDVVNLDLFYSSDSGQSWTLVAEHIANDGAYPWDTTILPNGTNYTLKAVVSDGSLEGEDVLEQTFEIANSHPSIQAAKVEHIAGHGDGEVNVNVVDLNALTGHKYELTFAPSDSSKTYAVSDLDAGTPVLQAVPIDPFTEGPTFDGVRLWIKDFVQPIPNESMTKWIAGESNMRLKVEKDPGKNFVPLAADFEIRFYGPNADTSYSAVPSFRVPVNFQIWNVTDSVKMEFILKEYDEPFGVISENDVLTIITNRVNRVYNTSWRITFQRPILETTIIPDWGDVARIAISKPFSEKDVFRFQTRKDYVVAVESDQRLAHEFQLAQNYPNPFNAETTIEYHLAKPCKVSVKIYDILGREVTTLVEGRQKAGLHKIHWNGLDAMNRVAATGVYVVRLEAGEFVSAKKLVFLK